MKLTDLLNKKEVVVTLNDSKSLLINTLNEEGIKFNFATKEAERRAYSNDDSMITLDRYGVISETEVYEKNNEDSEWIGATLLNNRIVLTK